jgi:hypothetical protein
MDDFLKRHGSEVSNMLYTEWNWDDALRISKEEGVEEGIEIGEQRGIGIGEQRGEQRGIEIGEQRGVEQAAKAIRALAAGKTPEEAARVSGLSPDAVKKLMS